MKMLKPWIKPWHYDFIRYYLEARFNGAAAYRRVRPGVTKGTAKVNSCRLLKDYRIQELLHKVLAAPAVLSKRS
jgi:hypothetical protein